MRILLPNPRDKAEPAAREDARPPKTPSRPPRPEPYIDPRHAWAVTG